MPRLHSNDIFAAMHYNRTVTVSSLREINNIRAHVHTLLNSLKDTVFEVDKMESSEHYTAVYLSKPTSTSPSPTGYSPFGTMSISPNPYSNHSSLIPSHPYLTNTTPNPPPNYKLTIDLLVPLEAPQPEIDAYNTFIESLTLYPSATHNA